MHCRSLQTLELLEITLEVETSNAEAPRQMYYNSPHKYLQSTIGIMTRQ